MSEGLGGRLAPSPRVNVKTSKAGATTYTDRNGTQTVLELIEIEVAWGVKEGDRWQGVLVKDPGVLALLEKIKGKSPHAAKLYASKLPSLIFLDYRYGACDQSFTHSDGSKAFCDAPVVIPGQDGYRCSRCGWVRRIGFVFGNSKSGRKSQRSKEKKIEQVPLDRLPSSQLELFVPDPVTECEPVENAIEVWQAVSEADHEAASLELLEDYQDD